MDFGILLAICVVAFILIAPVVALVRSRHADQRSENLEKKKTPRFASNCVDSPSASRSWKRFVRMQARLARYPPHRHPRRRSPARSRYLWRPPLLPELKRQWKLHVTRH